MSCTCFPGRDGLAPAVAGLGVPVGGGAGLAHRLLGPEDSLLALALTRPGHRGGL